MKKISDGHSASQRRLALASLASVIVIAWGGTTPAIAAGNDHQPTSIEDATQTLAAILPNILAETVDSANVEVTVDYAERGATKVHLDTTNVQILNENDSSRLAPESSTPATDAYVSPSLTITPTYTTGTLQEQGGLTVLDAQDDAVAAYIQPLEEGVRIMTAIASPGAPESYSYELDVPAGTHLRSNSLGYLMLGPDDEALGQLHSPWAVDADGREVPTSFQFADGVLTQYVDLSGADIAYPVIADPAWTYSSVHGIINKTVAQVSSLLRSCFNCYFPVEGAPRPFPAVDQYLPLRVFGQDFSCFFNYAYQESYAGQQYFGYSFRASSTHIDGVGSGISFDFDALYPDRPISERGARLIVNGYIMNSNPGGLPQAVYVAGARNTWQNFADNLYRG